MRSSVVATLLCLTAVPAAAHFKLVAPQAMNQQNASGDPQKSAPCGQDDIGDPWVPTNAVTTVQTGSMLTVTIDETIYHPGHYRVALAPTMNDLPADPPVTSSQQTACASVPIQSPPVFPVLADGMLAHTAPFAGQRSFQVQLPAGMECENCVLQVIEWMSNHGAPCFYHHCSTVTISNAAPPPPDAGVTPDSGGGGGGVDDPGGCCGVGAGAPGSALLALGIVALVTRRRRSSH